MGRTITLGGEQHVVLGVMPEDYQSDPPTDLYLPGQFDPNSTNQGHIYAYVKFFLPVVRLAAEI